MALATSIQKAVLSIADMDRGYYRDHDLKFSRHVTETDERMMVRLVAFARHASETLAFAKGRIGGGVDAPEEPDLWERDLAGDVDLWIEVGLVDERKLRQACRRAKRVVVYAYGGRKADSWWKRFVGAHRDAPQNLTVYNLSPETTRALAEFGKGDLRLNVTIQDGEMTVGDGTNVVEVNLAELSHLNPLEAHKRDPIS